MARTLAGGERALLAGDRYAHIRVDIENDSGTYINVTALGGRNWFRSAEWDESIDSRIAGGTCVLKRESDGDSLAPLMESSDFNVDNLGDYAPLIHGARGIRLYVQTTANGVAADPDEWRPFFFGKIDNADWAGDGLVITFRDLGADLADAWIRDEVVYGTPEDPETEDGRPVAEIIQQIITDNGSGVTLVGTVDVMFRPFRQAQKSVLEAIGDLALQIGYDLRYWWNASDQSVLTLRAVDRADIIADWAIGPSEYLKIDEISLGDRDIRNVGRVKYKSIATGEIEEQEYTDAESVSIYGERFLELAEDAVNNIDTAEEALALITAVIKDLATPFATHRATMRLFWPVQLNDVITYTPNGIHYDTPLTIAVSSFRHSITDGIGRTQIAGRGKPAGAFKQWLRRIGRGKVSADIESRMPVLINFRVKVSTPSFRTYAWTRGQLTREVWAGEVRYPTDAVPDEPFNAARDAAAGTPPLDEDELTVVAPDEGETVFLQVEPRGLDLLPGKVVRVEWPGEPAPIKWQTEVEVTPAGVGIVTVTIEDPRGIISTVRFWRTFLDTRTGPIAATSSGPPTWTFNTALHPKHATIIQVQIQRNDGGPDIWSELYTLDIDVDPEITETRVSYVLDQATVLVDADDDAVSLWYREVIAGTPGAEVEMDYRDSGPPNRFGIFEVTASPDDKRLFRVYAKNANGDAGEYREVEVDRFDIPDRIVRCLPEVTDSDADSVEMTVNAISPVAGSRTVELVSIFNTTIISGAAIGVEVAAGSVWEFSRPDNDAPGYVVFRAHQTGLIDDDNGEYINEQGRDTVGLKIVLIPLISSNPAEQNVRALWSDPLAETAFPYGQDSVEITYSSEGTGAITRTSSGYEAPTDNPFVPGYVTPGIIESTRPDVPTFKNYVDFTIQRPAHGSDPGLFSIRLEADNRTPDVDQITISPTDRLAFTVEVEQIAADDLTIELAVTPTDAKPIGGSYITLTEEHTANIATVTPSSSGAMANGATRNYIVDRPEFRQGTGQIVFKANATDRVQGSAFAVIPEQMPEPIGNITQTVNPDGSVDAEVSLPEPYRSILWLASTDDLPTRAEVLSGGAVANGRLIHLSNIETLEMGESCFLTIVAFLFTDAVGVGAPEVTATITRQNKVVQRYRKYSVAGFSNDPAFPFAIGGGNAYVEAPASSTSHGDFVLDLPQGATINELHLISDVDTPTPGFASADVDLIKLDEIGGKGIIADVTRSSGSSGWQTDSNTSFDEEVDGTYGLHLTFRSEAGYTTKISTVAVGYLVPDFGVE